MPVNVKKRQLREKKLVPATRFSKDAIYLLRRRKGAKSALVGKIKDGGSLASGAIRHVGGKPCYRPANGADLAELGKFPAGTPFIFYFSGKLRGESWTSVFFCIKRRGSAHSFRPLLDYNTGKWEHLDAKPVSGDNLKHFTLYRAEVNGGGHWFGRLKELAE